MKIYVASSWRNDYQFSVVNALRSVGHVVYDFRHEGFSWSEVDPNWKQWTPQQYMKGIQHPAAFRGFTRDMKALEECDVLVMVMPCGMSAGIEFGYAKGAGKPVCVYVPNMREADLMIAMADCITNDFESMMAWIACTAK